MTENQINEIVELLLDDLSGRRGFDAMWESLDYEIKDEIIEDWRELVRSVGAADAN